MDEIIYLKEYPMCVDYWWIKKKPLPNVHIHYGEVIDLLDVKCLYKYYKENAWFVNC